MLGRRDGPVSERSRVPSFAFPEPAAAALGRMYSYRRWLDTERDPTTDERRPNAHPFRMTLMLLLFGAFPLLAHTNTTDVHMGVLGPSGVGELLPFLQRAEADRLLDRKVAERRHEVAERRHESLLQSIDQISDAVVTAATSERVYTCAKAAAVLVETLNWAGVINSSMLCSATPFFSAQPHAESTHFLTSAHCFTDFARDGAAFANTAILVHRTLMRTCSLVHHFFCHPSESAACPAAAPSMDLAIVRCPEPLPAPSTRLSTLPQQHFQRAFVYGFSDGQNVDPLLVYSHKDGSRSAALHLKFARLAPSMQTPLALNISNATTVQLLSSTAASPAAGSEGAALPLDSYQGFLNIVPEEGMSGGAVVDSQCGALGVTERRSVFGEGGAFVKLSPNVVQRILAAMDKLANASAG
jgi:hypothetical protein